MEYKVIHIGDTIELGYSPDSGVKIIYVDGLPFKDFIGDGVLRPYEDWRLTPQERARDLASRLSVEEIAGLMLYSPQNHLDTPDITDAQRHFLLEDNVRHVLVSRVDSPSVAAKWNNSVQALVEGRTHGIPANNSSDPRHLATPDAEFAAGASGKRSLWSNLLGLAATFDPEQVEEFGRIAAREYRLQGIATALSPQGDLGTDPRWYRYSSTFGCDPKLVADLTRAYADGFQSPDGNGWSRKSVNTMAKHWPGGGCGEGGRDAHYGNGKYAVYPGGCYELHKIPFVNGAFDLRRGTGASSAVMPYYTIPYGQTPEDVANGYNSDVLLRQLRQEAGFEGVICTDWLVTHDSEDPGIHSGKPWGVENLSVAERHYKALMAGVDQFGGNNEMAPVLEAYKMGVSEHGEEWMMRRFEESAYRLLLNMFRVGLFENPYIDVSEAERVVGCPEFMAKGYAQQLRSIVLLKNKGGVLPLKKGLRLYIPKRKVPGGPNYWRLILEERVFDPVPVQVVERDFAIASSPDDADAAVVFIESPHSYLMGYDNGYIPISLQYEDYIAIDARGQSIAGERSYRGKSARTINKCDMEMVHQVREEMGDKPVIVVINMLNPMVMKEIEPYVDVVIVGFDVQGQAIMDIISGRESPSGLLPFQLPKDMSAVELHCEDKPHDMTCYCDTEGNVYDFAFGLDWDGKICDERVERGGGVESSKNL